MRGALLWRVMRLSFPAIGVALSLVGCGLYPRPTTETVDFTPAKRERLVALRNETKFQPHDYPPLGYTGAAPDCADKLPLVIDRFIDAILRYPDGALRSKSVITLIPRTIRAIQFCETEDRDRAIGYILEVWYILGFCGSTGQFGHGSAYMVPEGYGEPLPTGWAAPDKPRPVR